MRRIAVTLIVLSLVSWATPAKVLEVGLLLTPKQRAIYEMVFEQFTYETGVDVKILPRNDSQYKEQLPRWLSPGASGPDVLYWQASQRLFALAQDYPLLPINDLWQQHDMDKSFASIEANLSYQGNIYAIPYSYYHWGLYFKKSVVARYGPAPNTWQEFLALCEKMKNDGLTPIGLGTKNNWPAAAWFDYLNLRVNGLQFHRQVLNGKVSFFDARIRKVFNYWKTLLERGYFNDDTASNTWEDIASKIHRERVGFTLMGNFIANKWPRSLRMGLGFTPFPTLGLQPPYELAPTEVLMLNPNTRQPELAKEFLVFVARADTQSLLNSQLGYLPPHNKAITGSDPFIQQGHQLLLQASGVAQYFDRDTQPAFEKLAVPLLAEFAEHADIGKTLQDLEKARRQVFDEEL